MPSTTSTARSISSQRVTDSDDATTITLYGAAEAFPSFGAGHSAVLTESGRSLTRFSVGRLRAFVAARTDAAFRAGQEEILLGGLRDVSGTLERYTGKLTGPRLPLALHINYGPGAGGGSEVLYWKDRDPLPLGEQGRSVRRSR